MNGITKVTDLVGEIASASNEQAQGIGQISEALGQIDQVTQSNTASAEESASAAEELSSQATHLNHMLTRFKLTDSNDSRRDFPESINVVTGTAGQDNVDWGGSTDKKDPGKPETDVAISLDDDMGGF